MWNIKTRKKLRTFDGSLTAALSLDGRLLATETSNGDSIELYDVGSGKLKQRMPRVLKRAEDTVDRFTFSPDGNLLDVTANGNDDHVYEVSTGKLLATLTHARHGQFSTDGLLLIAGNAQHLSVWNTKTWTKIRDLPNGPDYVTTLAIFLQSDLVVLGGPKFALLRRLSSGQEIGKIGTGYTIFAAFNPDGSAFSYSNSSGLTIWDSSGQELCSRQDIGNGNVALSADGRWLGADSPDGRVMIWNVQKALAACGIPAAQPLR